MILMGWMGTRDARTPRHTEAPTPMKNLIRVLALATATVLPAAAFAQGGDKAPAAKPADDKAAAPADKGAAAPADTKAADDKGKKHTTTKKSTKPADKDKDKDKPAAAPAK